MSTPVTYNDTSYRSIASLASHLNLSPYVLQSRYKRNTGADLVANTAIRPIDIMNSSPDRNSLREIEWEGRMITYTMASAISGIKPQTLHWRKRAGWPDHRLMAQPPRGSS